MGTSDIAWAISYIALAVIGLGFGLRVMPITAGVLALIIVIMESA
jgi:hypothetical protein